MRAGVGGRIHELISTATNQATSRADVLTYLSGSCRAHRHDERRYRGALHLRRAQVSLDIPRSSGVTSTDRGNPSVPILEHTYRSRLPSASSILPLYLEHPAPRPSLVYLPSASPPVTVFSIVHANLLFLAPSDVDSDPLLVLEFLHRVVDVLEEFIGAPLLSSKLQANYDVVAQLLTEMCDAGIVCNTEPNALQEVVEVPGWMDKLLGGVGLPGLVYTCPVSL